MNGLLRAALFLTCFVSATSHAEAPISVELVSANPLHVVQPGEESKLALRIVNQSNQAQRARLDASVREFDGVSSPLEQELTLAPREVRKLAVPLGARRLGPRTIAYRIRAAAGERQGTLRFVYAPLAGRGRDPAGFFYGVCSHVEHDPIDQVERQMLAASQIGINTMRFGEEWASLEKEPGQWSFDGLDRRVALAERFGLQIQMLIAYGNAFAAPRAAHEAYRKAKASGDPQAWLKLFRAAPEDEFWRRLVFKLASRYRGRVAWYELWNEPDFSSFFLGSTDDYIRMLRSGYAEVKRADPKAKVMTGGFAMVARIPLRELNPDLQERVLAEASDSFDVHAYHEHSHIPAFVQAVDGELTRMRRKLKQPRPLFFNETGMTSRLGDEKTQALAVVKKITVARSRGAIGYNWYDLRDDGTNPEEGEHNYGLLTRDYQPKPSYAAYNELIRKMRGTRFVTSLATGPDRHIYLFADRSRYLLVAWSERTQLLPHEKVALSVSGAPAAIAFDVMGNGTRLELASGALELALRNEPTYVELRGAKSEPRLVTRE